MEPKLRFGFLAIGLAAGLGWRGVHRLRGHPHKTG